MKKLIFTLLFALVLVPCAVSAQTGDGWDLTNPNDGQFLDRGGSGNTGSTGGSGSFRSFNPGSKPAALNDLNDVFDYIAYYLNYIFPLLIAVAVFYIIWNIFKYWIVKGGSAEAHKEGATYIVFAVIALAVIFSIWGLVRLVQNTFGFQNHSVVPQIQSSDVR